MRADRYSRDARNKVKPGRNPIGAPVQRHFGDEMDEEDFDTDGRLCVIPVREFSSTVVNTFDVLNDAVFDEPVGPVNQLGPCIAGAVPVVTTEDFDSYTAAFKKRAGAQPDINDNCTPTFQKNANKLWDDLGEQCKWENFDVDDDLVEEWLQSMDAGKRGRMRCALDSMFNYEDDAAYLASKSLSVKIEVLMKRYDKEWAPRLIYAGNDHFNALTGPVAMVLNKRLAATFAEHRLGSVDYRMAYATDDVQLAAHLSDNVNEYPHGAEGDFSANDLRQREFAADLFDKAAGVLGAPSWFRKLLLDQKHYRVYSTKYGHAAELDHQLATGTTITTPRNTVWNATNFSEYCMVTGNAGVAVVLGDDLAGQTAKLIDSDHWSAHIAGGSKMKLTGCAPQLSGKMTFLSRRFCTNTEIPCMMPKLGKALARFNVRASKNQGLTDSAYMAGKALSYAYEFRHFEYWRDLFLERFEQEQDNAAICLREVSWFSRKELQLDSLSQAEGIKALLASVRECPVIVPRDDYIEMMLDAYGDSFEICQAEDLGRRIIMGDTIELLDNVDGLEVDWE